MAENIVLWRHPVLTTTLFIKSLYFYLKITLRKLTRHKKTAAICSVLILGFYSSLKITGPHQKYVLPIWAKITLSCYWVFLGMLSSIGLGTGLHTFVLYLGPHIAAVTLAAYECNSVAFPTPPYPDEIICPEGEGEGVTLWTIMSKVRLEAMMWGLGTAIGELPPYLVAKAARLSGGGPSHELKKGGNLTARVKQFVIDRVENMGFFFILLLASVPNPLFDFAGISCGHFLVPFSTFFGATLIGKAVIKTHIQQLCVILAFNETLLEKFLNLKIPIFGEKLQKYVREFIAKEKGKLRGQQTDEGLFSWIFGKIVIIMVAYFVISLINSLAQGQFYRNSRKEKRRLKGGS